MHDLTFARVAIGLISLLLWLCSLNVVANWEMSRVHLFSLRSVSVHVTCVITKSSISSNNIDSEFGS